MFKSNRLARIIGLILLSGVLIVTATGCRGLFGRDAGPIDAFAFLPQSNEQLSQPVQGAINNRPDPKEIVLVVPPGTDMSRLVASITLNTEATITVISSGRRVPQNSLTPNNFSSPVTYGIEIPGEDEPILYTVQVREASTNARLIELSIAGSVYQRPTFGPNVGAYEAEVLFATGSIQVTARAEDPKAFAISINGTRAGAGQGSAPVDFSVGDSTEITVEVVAEDQNTRQEYRITVVRGAPDRNSNLSALSVEGSVLDQVFRVDRKSYDAEIAYSAKEITVVVQPESQFSTVRVNDIAPGETGSATVSLDNVQKQMVDVIVTAQDGSTSIYAVSLNRAAPNSNTNLASLVVQGASLDQVFRMDRRDYTVEVPFGAQEITLAARPESEFSVVHVNDMAADEAGRVSLALDTGQKQSVVVEVTAQNGSTSAYSIVIVRAPADVNAALAGIATSIGQLSPAFSPEETFYSLTLPQGQSAVTVSAQAANRLTLVNVTTDVGAVRPGAGGRAGQTSLSVAEGEQALIIITTTAESGATRDYRIAVRRDIGINRVVLSELTMSGATLAPAFDPQVTVYTTSVAADVDVVRVVATPLDPTVELYVGDRLHPEWPAVIDILLYEGVTVKTIITLKAPNDLERVYTIGVARPETPSRIGRRILEVNMDGLRLSRQVASSLNSNNANLDAEAKIEVRYHDDGEIIYEDSAPVTTEKARQDVLVSMRYRSQFIDVDLGRYLDIEVSIPTTAGRYLHYNTVVFADDSLDIRPDFMALSDSARMDWPQAGTPRPVTARVLYQTSDETRNRIASLGDAFRLDSQGEFEITLELIDLATGRSLGIEMLPAKPASVHGRGIEFANGIELPEGAKVGYVLTAQTRDGRLLRVHGATQVRTLETFDNGEWEYASLFVDAVLELIEPRGK